MNWQDLYKSKFVDEVTAFKNLKSGDVVALSPGCAEPITLATGLGKRMRDDDIEHLVVSQYLPFSKDREYMAEDIRHKLRFRSGFVSGYMQEFINNDIGEYDPCHFSEWGELNGPGMNTTVACCQVSSPDKHGFVSLGLSNAFVPNQIAHARIVVAEVHPDLPRTHGDGFYHVSDFTHFVESRFPIIEVPMAPFTEVEGTIGQYIGELVNDYDCLQVGIGSLPNAVVSALGNKRGLGVHTETFSDSMMALVEQGVVDCKHKSFMPQKIVATFLMGTKKFYDWLDDNPMLALMRSDLTNDPKVIGKNDNLISINSALAIDLMGQVAAESLGAYQFSGTGGQVDFIRGTRISKGGRSVIAFPSTGNSKGVTVSRIVSQLPMGTPVTTTRNDVDYIVTEYGVARMRNKSLRERANALIAIAHPDFRNELKEELKRLKW